LLIALASRKKLTAQIFTDLRENLIEITLKTLQAIFHLKKFIAQLLALITTAGWKRIPTLEGFCHPILLIKQTGNEAVDRTIRSRSSSSLILPIMSAFDWKTVMRFCSVRVTFNGGRFL